MSFRDGITALLKNTKVSDLELIEHECLQSIEDVQCFAGVHGKRTIAYLLRKPTILLECVRAERAAKTQAKAAKLL